MEVNLEKINALIPIHQGVAGFNPALGRLYPIAVVEGDEFLIYDHADGEGGYRFIKTAPTPMPVPQGVRAAFQLADYDGRIACVVTPEVFDDPEGYVTILHEFVHCYQYETCEQDLKYQLDVARQAKEKGDVMWEIEYPFPYRSGTFTRGYQAFFDAVLRGNAPEILEARRTLRAYLGLHDFEYMVWQEWKEGFARWVENCLKQELGLKVKTAALLTPFSRVNFYTGGAALVDYLYKQEPSLVKHLQQLFNRISLPVKIN